MRDLNQLNEYGVPLHACNGYRCDEHYWAWIKHLCTGSGGKTEEVKREIRATWERHSASVQKRLIEHGYAPGFVAEELAKQTHKSSCRS